MTTVTATTCYLKWVANLVVLLMVLLSSTTAHGAVGDIHDANRQWSPTENPHGNWSYHVGTLFGDGGRRYEDLCVPASFKDKNYWSDSTDNANATIFRGHERDPDEYGGHGPFMVRWTAPAATTGAVQIQASIEQLFEPSRQMRLLIRHNGVDLAHVDAIAPQDNTGRGRRRVHLDPQPTVLVRAGDKIDFITDGHGANGTGMATTASVMSRLVEVEPPSAFNLTVVASPAQVTSVEPLGSSKQPTGEPVDLTADTYNSCDHNDGRIVWEFDYWDGPVDDPFSPHTSLTSVGQDVTLTANYVNVAECSDVPAIEISRFDSRSGSWQQHDGLLLQTDAAVASAVTVAPIGDVYRYRFKARVKLEPTDKIGAEAGIVVHVSEDSYILASVRRNKGGYYAMLTRFAPEYGLGRMPGDMVALPAGSGTQWHTIEVLADGAHIQVKIDEQIELVFSYPLNEGRPIGSGDQSSGTHLASNWQPKLFRMNGKVGFATRSAAAKFQFLEGESLPRDVEFHTPFKPRYDASGRVQPRWPYAWIMRKYTQWFLDSRQLVSSIGGSHASQNANLDHVMEETNWPPYFFSWATVIDDMGLDHPTQFPTHNGPPTISGYLQYYLFSGDQRFTEPARQWADWVIERFSTPADFALPYLPKSTYSYIGAPYEAHMEDTLELDKASYMGLSYLDLHGVTGDEKYLHAAKRIADSLLPHQRTDGSIPFRIDLVSGEVTGGYTCSQIWHAQLMRKLAALTGESEYQQAARRLLDWILQGPIKTNQWWGFYGDNPDGGGQKSMDQWAALVTAQWLIDHHQENEAYLPAARRVLSYIEEKFFKMGGVHQGVPAIGEQTGWPAILPHHNMRLADTYARLYGVTGDPEAKELAVRIANSMTQMAMNDGKFHHGLNSGIEDKTMLALNFNLQFTRIMAEIPETAPQDANHLLYSSGYARSIEYLREAITYQTLGPTQDILVVQSRPQRIEIDGKMIPALSESPISRSAAAPVGWLYEPDYHRLIIVHPGGQVAIRL